MSRHRSRGADEERGGKATGLPQEIMSALATILYNLETLTLRAYTSWPADPSTHQAIADLEALRYGYCQEAGIDFKPVETRNGPVPFTPPIASPESASDVTYPPGEESAIASPPDESPLTS